MYDNQPDKALQEIIDNALKQKNAKDAFLNVSSLLTKVSNDMEKTKKEDLLEYHIPELNHHLGGILPASLIVIGSDTGVGKSQFLSDLVYKNVTEGKKVAYFDLENDEGDFVRRQASKMVSMKHGKFVGVGDFYTNEILKNKKYADAIPEVFSDIEEAIGDNLFLFNNKEIPSFDDFAAYIDYLTNANDIDLVCIDHLHYFSMAEKEIEAVQLGKIMRGLRNIAKKGTPVVIASHLRPNRKSPRPGNGDLFGSSNIAKEASVVILFSKDENETIMEVTKMRHGGMLKDWTGVYDQISRRIDFSAFNDNKF